MIQLRMFLEGRTYVQHLRGHQTLHGLISRGNADVGATDAGACLTEVLILPMQNATQKYDLTLVNWREHKYPQIPMTELKRIVHTCKTNSFSVPPTLTRARDEPKIINWLGPNIIWQKDIIYYPPF